MVAQFGLFVAVIGAGRLSGPEAVGGAWQTAGNALFVAGLALGALGALPLGRRLSPFPQPVPAAQLRTTGIFGLVRHPIYGGVILLFAGIAVRSGSWVAMVLAATLVPFFWAKSRHEERLLEKRFPEYAEYRQKVRRRLLPFLV